MTVADTIALISLLLGFQAILMWFYQRSIESVVNSHDSEVKTIIRNRLLLQRTHSALIECLGEHASMSRLYATLLIRAHSQLSPTILPTIATEIAKYDFDLQRSLHELDLFSADGPRRESAMRKLAEEYGDLGSLDLMRQVVMELFADEQGPWRHCISQLEARIVRKIRA